MPGDPDIRLLAIDLDGTLLNDAKVVSDRTLAALRCLRPGIKVVIASARPPRSVRPIYRQLGLNTWQVNYNGALIWDEPRQKIVLHRPMAGDRVEQMIRAARKQMPDVLVSCEILDRWYTDRDEHSRTTETGKLFGPDCVCAVEEICRRPVTKLMFLGEPGALAAVRARLGADFGGLVQIVSSSETDLIQIMDRDAGKGRAIEAIAQQDGLTPEQVLAIGDAPNDLDMFHFAGTSVSMGNASEEVRQAADWVAPSNNDHGVHATLVRFGLCQE